MFYRCAWVCCVLLCLIGVSNASQCNSTGINSIKFTLLSRRNSTGNWITEVRLGHGAHREEQGPWEVDINHSTEACEESEAILIAATVTAPVQRPSNTYELLPGLGYYKFHGTPRNWFEARKICTREGAHLFILNSEDEGRALLLTWWAYPKVYDDWRNKHVYTGVHDNFVEGEFVTIFNQPLNSTGYSKWRANEPNGNTRENCVTMDGNYGTLVDMPCSTILPFFCEREMNSASDGDNEM
ncbi:hemolymph lipopolysaccharide-binding protein-like [Periplaneta americana]|uniref:hemolymph lipopolysaccharide-binding protein-like n=1 Tax=Periplaneta americana TaxID=6978 RepID=UPI0037E989F0